MKDAQETAVTKRQVGTRLRAAIVGLSRQAASVAQRRRLDRALELVSSGYALSLTRRDVLDAFIPFSHLAASRSEDRFEIVLHEVGQAIQRYWELERSDETVGLGRLLDRLDAYVQDGFRKCEVLGGPETGYVLFNRKHQARIVEDAKRRQQAARPPAVRGKQGKKANR